MTIEQIFAAFLCERQAQDAQHGGADHDDAITLDKWINLLVRHVGLAASDGGHDPDPARFRRQMVRVGALAVAALQALDRASERQTTLEHTLPNGS